MKTLRFLLALLLLSAAAASGPAQAQATSVTPLLPLCATLTLTDTYVLTYSGSGQCWNAAAASAGSSVTWAADLAGSSNTSQTVAAGAITLAKMANLTADSLICNNTGSGAVPIACTVAQAKTLLAYAFSDLSGSAACGQLPALTGDTTTSAGSCAQTTVALNGTNLAGLATGLLKITTATGVPTSVAAPAGAVVGTTDSQTLTNKSIASSEIVGTATNDNAATGGIGEYWEVYCSVATSGASIAFTSASPTVGTYSSPPWALVSGSQAAFGSFACPFVITAGNPTGLSTATVYWAVPINATTFHVATSAANAMAGTFANTTGSSSTANLTSTTTVTSGTVTAAAAVKLTAGDWDCTNLAIFVPTSTTSVTALASGVGSSSTALPAIANTFVTAADVLNTTTTSPFNQASSSYRISLASSTAEYADVEGVFTASTLTAASDLRCRRMR